MNVTSDSGVVTLNLSDSQTFLLTTSENITSFTLIGSITQPRILHSRFFRDLPLYGVGIDTFRTSGGSQIPVYWPGGVLPIVTPVAG